MKRIGKQALKINPAFKQKVTDAQVKVIASWKNGHAPETFLKNLHINFPLISEATWKVIEDSAELAILKIIHNKTGIPIKVKEELSKRHVSSIGKMVFREELSREN